MSIVAKQLVVFPCMTAAFCGIICFGINHVAHIQEVHLGIGCAVAGASSFVNGLIVLRTRRKTIQLRDTWREMTSSQRG